MIQVVLVKRLKEKEGGRRKRKKERERLIDALFTGTEEEDEDKLMMKRSLPLAVRNVHICPSHHADSCKDTEVVVNNIVRLLKTRGTRQREGPATELQLSCVCVCVCVCETERV